MGWCEAADALLDLGDALKKARSSSSGGAMRADSMKDMFRVCPAASKNRSKQSKRAAAKDALLLPPTMPAVRL
jgi:hypothetical protein